MTRRRTNVDQAQGIAVDEATGVGGGTSGMQVIAVASGKGGVGKTWFSITLTHALARAEQLGSRLKMALV